MIALFLFLLQDGPSLEELKRHVTALSDDTMAGRCAGTAPAVRAAQYVAEEFKRLGLRTHEQSFDISLQRKLVSSNVIGVIAGGSEEESVVVGAHYDGVGCEDDPNRAGRLPGEEEGDTVWNGADDNASGVAALLEIARRLSSARPRRSITFIAFGAEEMGSLGAAHFVRSISQSQKMVAMINLHMMGRNPQRPLEVLSADSCSGWPTLLESAAKGILEIRVSNDSPMTGDQWVFANGRIPAVMLFGGFHPDYHTPSDEVERIAWETLVVRTRFAARLVLELADRPDRLEWSAPRNAGLGIQGLDLSDEEAEQQGLPPETGGVRIVDVLPGTPAEGAGLRTGDVLLEFGSQSLTRDGAKAELLSAIRSIRPGDEVRILFLREGKRLEVRARWPKK